MINLRFFGRALLVCCTLISAVDSSNNPASATFLDYRLEDVPAERLIANIEKKAKLQPGMKASFEFQLGRLYAMVATKGKLEVSVQRYRYFDTNARRGAQSPAADEITFAEPGVIWTDYRQLSANIKNNAFADSAIRMSIWHYRQALKLEPTNGDVSIGLAWALEQAGENTEAVTIYRQIVEHGLGDTSTPNGFKRSSEGKNRAYEAAGYLQKLLDPVADKDEIATLAAYPKPDYDMHVETPIVVPLQNNLKFEEIMQPAEVTFDLGMGSARYGRWPTAQAGWLVYDKSGRGDIDNGRKLFGSYSFFVFWQNGFEALSALDDNQDGKQCGAELENLAVWCDANRDGVCQSGEVVTLKALDIVELSCQAEAEADGMLRSEAGVTFKSGEKRPTYDVILPRIGNTTITTTTTELQRLRLWR